MAALAMFVAACGDDDDTDTSTDDTSADTDTDSDDGEQASGSIEAVEPFFPVDAEGNEVLPCGGYGFRLEDGDFYEAFNEQLNAFREDGTTMDIITGYEDFSEADVEKANELSASDIASNANAGMESGSGTLAELQEAGSITIGIANEVPFGFTGEDGEATGIAPDVAKAVLAELGITEVEANVVEFGQLIGGLQAGQYDLIAAGMYINEERAEQILFSDPDYCIAEGLAVPAGNPEGIVDYNSFVDNPDLTLAVATGTVEVGYAEDAGIPDDQLQVFADIDSMYAALEAGEVDAVTGTAATVQRQVDARS
ncbi:transporter substrate-binding domain-containing protein [Acidimicrobiia bacterium EGI L10123]|uniref:transporter substrate-binding domain-containing protein n=1 Tax=Salinilacustrithrix flava TaxID=2957203 RepID=UPI003D7C2F1A|nr:transporter substrate-binding domain-containing protein [Acidimicrobiia bacterium EGI L10123]